MTPPWPGVSTGRTTGQPSAATWTGQWRLDPSRSSGAERDTGVVTATAVVGDTDPVAGAGAPVGHTAGGLSA